jgi:hypothetical protein
MTTELLRKIIRTKFMEKQYLSTASLTVQGRTQQITAWNAQAVHYQNYFVLMHNIKKLTKLHINSNINE